MMLRILRRYFNSHLTENRRHLVKQNFSPKLARRLELRLALADGGERGLSELERVGGFRRSIELKPDYATAHQWYALHYLTAMGRLEEAVQEMKKALEFEPASLVMNTFMGATLYYAGPVR